MTSAAHEELETLRGQLLGRLRAFQQPVPMNVNRLSREELKGRYEELIPRGLRGDEA